MNMRKIILLIILAFFISLIFFALIYAVFHFVTYKYKQEPFDTHLNYFELKKMQDILKSLGYRIEKKFFTIILKNTRLSF